MIVVIQCAGRKNPDAGSIRQSDGKKVLFVAQPNIAPADADCVFARPDDIADTGRSWRDELRKYNTCPNDNPLGLLPAWRLYRNKIYKRLKERFGLDHLYILSAGWGLIRADFLTPRYDITFSYHAAKYKRRRKMDRYKDLRMLSEDIIEPIVFFVSAAYVGLACELTKETKARKYLFYNSKVAPKVSRAIIPQEYFRKKKINWPYDCASDFMCKKICLNAELR